MSRQACALVCVTAFLCGSPATAQSLLSVTDDIILITKGQTKNAEARTRQNLIVPGADTQFGGPGADTPRLGLPLLQPPPRGVLTAAAEGPGRRLAAARQIAPPAPLVPKEVPLYGALELPTKEDEGPPDGMTLDQAIERLLRSNYDLLTKYQDIPKADADILSAGLRLNPFLFATVDNVPYGSYSPQRPGNNGYSFTLAQPYDFNQKRKLRVRVAQTARQVLQAQYQNAVRLEIDNLYTAFVDVLQARQMVQVNELGLEGMRKMVKLTGSLIKSNLLAPSEMDRARIQEYKASISLQAAQKAYRQARQSLAALLAIPADQAAALEIRGKLHEDNLVADDPNQLISMAIEARPDLQAYRLGVQRARAAVQVTQAERLEDVYLFWTPYSYTNYHPIGAQSASSWSAGILLPLPLYNRNQGNIARARLNLNQTEIELEGIKRQIANEVQQTYEEYSTSRAGVQAFERDVLPAARRVRQSKYLLFEKGQEDLGQFLAAQREYNEYIREYLELLTRHRRDALHLNSVIGQRIEP